MLVTSVRRPQRILDGPMEPVSSYNLLPYAYPYFYSNKQSLIFYIANKNNPKNLLKSNTRRKSGKYVLIPLNVNLNCQPDE